MKPTEQTLLNEPELRPCPGVGKSASAEFIGAGTAVEICGMATTDLGVLKADRNRLVQELESAGASVRGSAFQCPFHDDRKPSGSIFTRDGVWFAKCHGCEFSGDVIDVVRRAHSLDFGGAVQRLGMAADGRPYKKPAKAYPFRQAAEAAVLAMFPGGRLRSFTYSGRQVVVRIDFDDGREKEIRPIHGDGENWHIGKGKQPWPLYRVTEALQHDRIYVVEGEGVVDAGWNLGLPCVSSVQGARAAHKSDWSPLRGKTVVVLPDNDAPGHVYAESVARILYGLDCSVKLVSLPELAEGGDLVDWAETDKGKSPAALCALVEQLVADAPKWKPPVAAETSGWKTGPAPVWRPFPVAVLPEPMRSFVVEGARAIGCDESMLALPALASCAAAIGTTRRVKLKNSWHEPSIVWTGIVARSGSLKSPASELAVKPLQRMQSERFREHDRALAEHERRALHYEAGKADWRRNTRDRGDPPEKPEPPVCVRYVVSDCTVESLAPILQENARGVLLAKDELSGWLQSFNQYKGNKGSDVANWLEMHRAGCVTVDRKTQRTLHVPRAAVSICGTIQPGVLSACLTDEYFAAGLPPRLLVAQPPTPAKRWTDDELSPATFVRFEDVIRKLLAQEHDRDDDGELMPKDLPLSSDARMRWIDFYDEFATRQGHAPGDDLAAAFSKIEAYAARFALLYQCVSSVTGTAAADCVDDGAMEAGIRLARWFADEAERVYGLWHESDEDRKRRALIAWIKVRGGQTTPGDLQRANRTYRKRGDAQVALDDLVAAKLGAWEYVRSDARDGTQRGRQSKVFRLSVNGVNVNDNGCDDSASANFVDVDTVDGSENEVGEWAR